MLWTGSAIAECGLPNWFRDALGRAPMTTGDQCRFENAGNWRWTTEGGPVTAFGGSLVAQKLTTFGCGKDEEIRVSDCETGELVTFFGTTCGGPILTIPFSTVECFDGTDGLLQMSQSSTLSQLAESAERNGVQFRSETISEQFEDFPINRRPKANCGCKLYYPDSPGAKL